MKADVASGIEDTEILMTSYEDNTSQGKGWILDQVVRFTYVPRKSCSIIP